MKKSFLCALTAFLYIIIIVFVINTITSVLPGKNILVVPMAMLSLFVLSAAIMGFLFLSEPLHLYMENQKQEAITFFTRVVGFFACFVALFLILFFFV